MRATYMYDPVESEEGLVHWVCANSFIITFCKKSSYLSVLHVSFGNVDCRHKRLWLWLVQMDDRGAQPTHRDLQEVSQILQPVRIRGRTWRKTKTKLLERVLVGVV
jgi:hypothetical protein